MNVQMTSFAEEAKCLFAHVATLKESSKAKASKKRTKHRTDAMEAVGELAPTEHALQTAQIAQFKGDSLALKGNLDFFEQ